MYLEVLSTQTLSSAEKKAQAYLALPSTGSTLLVKPTFLRISSYEGPISSPSDLHLRLEVYSITRSTVPSNPPTFTKELLFSVDEGAVPSSSVTIDINKLVPKLAPTAPPLVLLPCDLSRFFTKIVDRVKIEETERCVHNANRRKARKRA
ncbi:hypothetical protein Rhopal_006478-T1 [Rhodotorula paludigena]|uniref:Uncharacterized protein n=1 Tax=Rhodotorula paludigena TaxID=86838 RepID=A0AAV5GT67_9BASI|nr:hypothetical protein Rhopal_006478-T1 [Rhodotorula paludigena]